MAYPRYIGKSAFASGQYGITVAALTGTQAGDIIILFAESANDTITTPTGYSVLATQVGTGTSGAAGGVRIASFYRIMGDAADTSTTVAATNDHTTAIKMLFRDTSLASGGGFFVTATSTQGTASTSMTFPAVTTATDESLVVLGVALDTDANSTAVVSNFANANLANIAQRHSQTVATNTGGGLAVYTGQKATAGSTGTSTATGSTSVVRAYHTISLSRVAAQTTTTDFKTVSTTTYFPISDAMRITADASGKVNATSSGTFQPNTLTDGTYALNLKWYYRQLGTDSWTASTAQASTVSAVVSGGALTTTGSFTDNESITGLTNGVEYEFVLFAARQSATPTNVIAFSATATISIPKSITADGGTYTYTGGTANLLDNKLVTADNVTFSYTGGTADLYYNKILFADAGTFSYSGTDADILHNKVVAADSATYSYTGTNATLTYTPIGGYTLTADAGSFSYSGTDANIKVAFLISADAGSYTYSGTDADVLVSRTIAADAGAFAYSGNDVNLLSGRQITADAGSFTYAGTAANLIGARKIIADAGSYAYTGTAASLNYGRKLVLDSGSFSYSGGSATLTFESGITKIWLGSGKISNLKIGSFQIYEAYLGSSQVWGRARPANSIVAETRSFTYTGSDATMFRGRKFSVNSGTYTYTGTANTLKVGRKLVADGTTYSLTGTAATLSNAYTWTRYATIYDDNDSSSSSITAVFNTNGTITFTTSTGDGSSLDTDFTHWHDGGTVTGIGNSRWAKKTSSGDPTTGTLTTSLVALSSSKTISISTVAGEGRSGVELVEIYSDSGGTTKVGQITLTITATI